MRALGVFAENPAESARQSPKGLKPCPVTRRIMQPALVPFGFACFKQHIEFGHDLEGVGDVDDVGFAACPSTVGIEGDGAALADEAPADDVRFFAMATG